MGFEPKLRRLLE